MAKLGRKVTDPRLRYKAIAEIIARDSTLSSREISKVLLNEYGISVSHTTITKDLQKDLDTLTEGELKNKKTHIIDSVEELVQDAFIMAKNDPNSKIRLAAMDMHNKTIKTLAEVLRKFEEAKLNRQQQMRPIYNIFIGEPTPADLKKLMKETKETNEKSEEERSGEKESHNEE